MSETNYLKCPCQKCGASIEFPVHGIGSAVPCPHCGEKTKLLVPPAVVGSNVTPPEAVASTHLRPAPATVTEESVSTSPESLEPEESSPHVAAKKRTPPSRLMKVALLALLLAGAGGALVAFRDKWSGTKLATPNGPASTRNLQDATAKNSESAQTGASTPESKPPKSPDDLKIGVIALEKAKGSSLVYVVGVLRNESDHQRFGVNIELELADAKGAKAGVAKDYRSLLDPREEWRFRALVLDTKAVSAKLSKIHEEE